MLPLIAIALLVAATGAIAGVLLRGRSPTGADIRPSGLPANVSTSLANLMALSPVQPQQAPPFTLVDQRGRTLSLASLRGRPVVLEFMDPHCTDICPLVAEEFLDAYRDLGRARGRVAFVAVNVNPYFRGVGAAAAFSAEYGLNAIPDWHFFTGSLRQLEATWAHYGITVEAQGPNRDVVHSSIVFFIGRDGDERFVASPTDDHTRSGTAYLPAGELSSWGRGIAVLARDLLG